MILKKWDYCGISYVENTLFPEMGIQIASIKTITGEEVNKILEAKGFEPLNGIEKEKFNIYFNYHGSTGRHTEIKCDDKGNVTFEVIKSQGYSLHAFCTEVIIFNYTGIDY